MAHRDRASRFIGHTVGASVNVDSAASVIGCEFNDLIIEGTLDGNSVINNCVISDLIYVNGTVKNSSLGGTITLGGGSTAIFINCRNADPTSGTPIIDMGGSGQSLEIREYYGGIELRNKTGPESVAIDLQGRVILDSTITDGMIRVRGIGHVEDSSTGTTTVDQDDLLTRATIADAVWNEQLSGHLTAGSAGAGIERMTKLESNKVIITTAGDGTDTVTIYDDDGVTPYYVFTVSPDKKIRTPV